MKTNQLSSLASLIGEPARTAMLLALMDGRALSAGELAKVAAIGAPAASRHLQLLMEAQLLTVEQQGKHRYFRLASSEVAATIENMLALAGALSGGGAVVSTGPRDAAMRLARSCYDHMAGRLGVALADQLHEAGAVAAEGNGAIQDASALAGALAQAELVSADEVMSWLDAATQSRRPMCKHCLDWSERRSHLAGQLGQRLLQACLDEAWLERADGTQARALRVTPKGEIRLRSWMGLDRWAWVQGATAR
ncbi:winged helix-turn-helix domain-containing protein [Hydrogenophaga sp. 5NK40-0174]|uniref:ArsR/SmtB family transcription factor n=1 Tax=Hydrogenophaga sp. 5NK40-0174 TaxID=3127649 RepID=UPI00333F1915